MYSTVLYSPEFSGAQVKSAHKTGTKKNVLVKKRRARPTPDGKTLPRLECLAPDRAGAVAGATYRGKRYKGAIKPCRG